MLYFALRILIASVCVAGGISVAVHTDWPEQKLTFWGALEPVVIFGVVFGFFTYRMLVREARQFPDKAWQAPFWTSSFDQSPANWVKTGILWAACGGAAIFICGAIGAGSASFGFIFMGFALGLAGGLFVFKRRLANQPLVPTPGNELPSGDDRPSGAAHL